MISPDSSLELAIEDLKSQLAHEPDVLSIEADFPFIVVTLAQGSIVKVPGTVVQGELPIGDICGPGQHTWKVMVNYG